MEHYTWNELNKMRWKYVNIFAFADTFFETSTEEKKISVRFMKK